jgi:hypothetical protein
MDVSYKLSQEDFLRGVRFAQRRSPVLRRIRYSTIVIGALIPTIAAQLCWGNLTYTLLMVLGMLALLSVVTFGAVMYSANLRYKNLDEAMRQATMDIRPECLTVYNEAIRTQMTWGQIQGIHQDNDYFFLMFNRVNVFIVPKRAFATSDQVEEFWSLANLYWQHSRGIKLPA